MNDTKLRIERSNFDLDIDFNLEDAISSGTSGNSSSSIMAELTLPAGLKPSDFIGKIVCVTLRSGAPSSSLDIVSTSVITSATSMALPVSGTTHTAIYCNFNFNFATESAPCLLVYDTASGAATAEMVASRN